MDMLPRWLVQNVLTCKDLLKAKEFSQTLSFYVQTVSFRLSQIFGQRFGLQNVDSVDPSPAQNKRPMLEHGPRWYVKSILTCKYLPKRSKFLAESKYFLSLDSGFSQSLSQSFGQRFGLQIWLWQICLEQKVAAWTLADS